MAKIFERSFSFFFFKDVTKKKGFDFFELLQKKKDVFCFDLFVFGGEI